MKVIEILIRIFVGILWILILPIVGIISFLIWDIDPLLAWGDVMLDSIMKVRI